MDKMIAVNEALQLLTQNVQLFEVETIDLLQSAGRILAQTIVADRDFPPFNRATMDGIAINSKAFQDGVRSFVIDAVQAAGSPQQSLTNPLHCIEIMTGAVLPTGTDAVIRYEDIILNGSSAQVNIEDVTPWQNVHLQGTDEKAGQILVEPRTKVTPAIIAIMASVGISQVQVYRLPKIAVCSTGDELVAVHEQPEPHQIRQSNSYMLLSALQQEGISAGKFHLPDESEIMQAQLRSLIEQYDALLFSGAVSKGKFDYLPQVLKELGMQTVFHSIAQKPGKPLLFGKMKNNVLVFGFPGNPVSTWICYQLYFRSWLYQSLQQSLPKVQAVLGKEVYFKPSLTYHVLVRLQPGDSKVIAGPVDTSTSGDMVNLMQAQGFVSLPANEDKFEAGMPVDVYLF